MRVLLATDGSEDARAATAWLTRFPLPAGAELRVVSVVNVPVAVLDVPPVHEFHKSLLDEAQRAAEAARAALALRFRAAEIHVAEGDARDVIARAAEEWRAELIVLGARGLGAVAGALLGSVSLGVARHARCSVLVVKGGTARLRGALVAIDGSPHSELAAAFLARLPLDSAFLVRLLGVAEPPRYPATTPALAAGLVRQAIDQIVKERRAALEQALAKAAAVFAAVVKTVERQIIVGRPVDEIVEAAARPDVDLVVVGARGLGALERILLGSVSEGVLRHADRPVLIVKTAAS
ncbi:MAG TPA: universal stress protein [Methylomirabilota bacterium]|nr:universal stress protein [Methylomirabilota bacterium]